MVREKWRQHWGRGPQRGEGFSGGNHSVARQLFAIASCTKLAHWKACGEAVLGFDNYTALFAWIAGIGVA